MGFKHALNDNSHVRTGHTRAKQKALARKDIQQELDERTDVDRELAAKQMRARQKTRRLPVMRPVIVSQSDADLPVFSESGRTRTVLEGDFDRPPAMEARRPESVPVQRPRSSGEQVVKVQRDGHGKHKMRLGK